MKQVTQSRTGDTGTCFRASLASILNLRENQVPDFGEANEDPGIDAFLSKYGLRYQEVPIGNVAPVGYHIITGISPRGGMHAVVGLNGQIVWDPHPIDGTAHGLVKQDKYGLLLPVAKDSRAEAEELRQRHDELKNNPLRHSGGMTKEAASERAFKELFMSGKKKVKAFDKARLHRALDAVLDAAEFKESEHPRQDDGKFGNKSGTSLRTKPTAKEAATLKKKTAQEADISSAYAEAKAAEVDRKKADKLVKALTNKAYKMRSDMWHDGVADPFTTKSNSEVNKLETEAERAAEAYEIGPEANARRLLEKFESMRAERIHAYLDPQGNFYEPSNAVVEAVPDWAATPEKCKAISEAAAQITAGKSVKGEQGAAAQALLDGVRDGWDFDKPLYRGMMVDDSFVESLKPGGYMDIDGLASFSADEKQAAHYTKKGSTNKNKGSVPLLIEARDVRGLPLLDMTNEGQIAEREVITHGKFRVENVSRESSGLVRVKLVQEK